MEKRNYKKKSLIERFMSLITIDEDFGCWVWQGCLDGTGNGRFAPTHGKTVRADKWVYEYYREKLPKGFCTAHICNNRRCCNPEHLEIITLRESKIRSTGIIGINARKTHCKHGHLLSKDNLLSTARTRICKTCYEERLKKRNLKRQEQGRNIHGA